MNEVQSEVQSGSSVVSLMSAPHKQRCFLAGSLFKVPDGRYVRADHLGQGSVVYSSSGTKLLVVSARVHPEQDQELINLHTENARLIVTASHRVMVLKGGQSQTIPADSLRIGDHVLVAGNRVEELLLVDRLMQCVEVVEITFHPDECVEAFQPLCNSILSKGHGWRRTRRSQTHGNSSWDLVSIPGTETSWLYEH